MGIIASVPHAGHRLYEQRLAAVLAQDHRVAYLDPATVPRSVSQLLRPDRGTPGGVRVHRPWSPPFSRSLGLRGVRDAATVRAARRVVASWGGTADGVVATGLSPAKDVLGPRRSALLVKDDYVAGAALLGQDAAVLERRLSRAVSDHHVVVAVSPELSRRLERFDVRAEVVPAGCWVPSGTPPDRAPGRRPAAVFLGGLGPRVVPEVLAGLLSAGCDVSIVGGFTRGWAPGPAMAAVLADPRVTHWGQVPEGRAFELLAAADVGVVPYEDSSFNAASFPLKVLEYLAAGLPVVSTPLPALAWIGSGHVSEAVDPAEFAEAVLRAAAAAGPETWAACRAEAEEHSWERRGMTWTRLLDLTPSPSTAEES